MKATVKGNKLTIEVDLDMIGTESTSGKSMLNMSTGGFTPIAGTGMKLNMMVISPIKKAKK